MEYSFVIPCYKSEKTISVVVDEIVLVMKQHNAEDYEIILVCDDSPDDVWSVIKKLVNQDSRIKGICLVKNAGQHSALLAGYRHCCGDYVVSLDDDGQTPIDELFKLVHKLEEGYDAVYAYYYETKQSRFRRFGSWMAKKMGEVLLGAPKDMKGSSFYIAKKFIIDEMIRYQNPYPYLGGLLLRTTNKIACVPTHHRKRMQGRSGYTFRKLFSLWINGFTAFSVKPLEIGIYSGVVLGIMGFLGAFITIIRKLVSPEVAIGWSSIISVLLILGGVILVMLGLIGEYIGRIYISINNSPQYVIRETVGDIKD